MVKWAMQIAKRRSKPVAVVALARKMTGILFALWRDEAIYVPGRGAPDGAVGELSATHTEPGKGCPKTAITMESVQDGGGNVDGTHALANVTSAADFVTAPPSANSRLR